MAELWMISMFEVSRSDSEMETFAVGVVSLSTDSDNLKNVAKNNLLFRSCLLMPFFFCFFLLLLQPSKNVKKAKGM